MKTKHTSRISGFYKKSIAERTTIIAEQTDLTTAERIVLTGKNLTIEQANNMIENVVGLYNLPLGIATNFLINGQDYLIPMVIEEPSVVAAISNAAKLFRSGRGFTTSTDSPIMIGQIQVLEAPNPTQAAQAIINNKDRLIQEANNATQDMIRYGGGTQDIQVRILNSPIGTMLIVHILYDSRDAMGANTINTAAEHIAPLIEEITGGRVNLKILSNLADQRKAYAEGTIPASELTTETLPGDRVVDLILEAAAFAEVDPYRATTHNKGIMNGIDAVVIATGNDWRAVEAGAHAYAARGGSYTSLTKWWKDNDGNLRGSIELPMAVGIVGGATRVHPGAQVALKILGVKSARELAEVIAAAGLAQNLAAMRALATVGIQRGHMRLHARQFAVAAGATGDMVMQIVEQMINEHDIRLERAQELVRERQEET